MEKKEEKVSELGLTKGRRVDEVFLLSLEL